MRLLLIAVALHLTCFGECMGESPATRGGRVETMAELEGYQSFHEIERLGLFLKEQGAIDLPNLQKAQIIKIESDQVTAVSLPSLESVSQLTIRGRNIKTIELPNLKSVSGALQIQGTSVRQLDLASLGHAGILNVAGNPELEILSAPFVYEFEHVLFANNPALDDATQKQLQSIELPAGSRPKPVAMNYAVRLRAPSIGPTGRKAARFNTRGSSSGRNSHRNVYPRYQPFYPIFRPFFGGFWGYGRGLF